MHYGTQAAYLCRGPRISVTAKTLSETVLKQFYENNFNLETEQILLQRWNRNSGHVKSFYLETHCVLISK